MLFSVTVTDTNPQKAAAMAGAAALELAKRTGIGFRVRARILARTSVCQQYLSHRGPGSSSMRASLPVRSSPFCCYGQADARPIRYD